MISFPCSACKYDLISSIEHKIYAFISSIAGIVLTSGELTLILRR